MTTILARPMTATEFAALPESAGWKYELLEGALLEMVGPGEPHAKAVGRLSARLGVYVEDHNLGQMYGEMGYLLNRQPDSVLIPDLSFISHARLHEAAQADPFWPGPPDLAVEVVSPNDRRKEVDDKIATYLAAGTRLVWATNPQTRQVAVHTLAGRAVMGESDVLDGGDVVPGFTLPVARLFD